ncbi:MAG: aminopeptidase [Oscillospiraceae bacterium]|nr:aminopeptidase [Oscillospiraceae bacterium]
MMKKTVLRSYARLIARAGVNIEKGQEVLIHAELDQPEFVQMVAEECYRAGAAKVTVDWNYLPLQKLNIRHRSVKTLRHVERWEEEKYRFYAEKLPCRIHLLSEDPDGLRGVNMEKMAKGQQSRYQVLRPYLDQMEGKNQWCIAAVPGAAWAKKVFPGLRTSQAVEKLWEAILYTSRVTDDPIQAWKGHNEDLARRCAYLNSLGITELHYSGGNGTDLRVGMIPEAEWKGGGETSLTGHFFNPNIPSEEVFISPMRGKAEGIVYSTKPLSYQGRLIENFSVRFEGGRAVEVHAEKNEALLRQMIAMDEGAAYLGECALVPYDSPIRNSDILFYNTLFDENAACHLALGRGFIDTIRDYGSYTLEQCRGFGVNESMNHEDFMIGSRDLSIDAVTADGKTVPIFVDGDWAF